MIFSHALKKREGKDSVLKNFYLLPIAKYY